MLPRFSRLKGAPTKPFDCNMVLVANQESISNTVISLVSSAFIFLYPCKKSLTLKAKPFIYRDKRDKSG